MIKYILAGGYIYKAADGGRSFCEELIKGFKKNKPVKILNCLFARNEDSWNGKLQENKEFFSRYINNFEIILADKERFLEQVKSSDIIFLQGGYTEPLIRMLSENLDWIKYLDGKTIAGTSAGGDAIAKYYSVLKTSRVGDGLGLLNIKFIPHWKSDYSDDEVSDIDWGMELKKIKEYKEDLPIYTLREGDFIVFNK